MTFYQHVLLGILFAGLLGCSPEADPLLTSRRIEFVKRSMVGHRLDVALNDVLVTYVLPEGPDRFNDPAGFFVQSHPRGSGLFIPLSPKEFQPYPKAGDRVSFTVLQMLDPELWLSAAIWTPPEGSEMPEVVPPPEHRGWFTGPERDGLLAHMNEAGSQMVEKYQGVLNGRIAIMDFKIHGRGQDTGTVALDATKDKALSQNIDPYVDRMLSIQGIVRTPFVAHGKGFVSATLGVREQASMASIWLRLPENLADSVGVRKGCTVKVGPSPLRRYGGIPVFSAWSEKEISVDGCPEARTVVDERTGQAPTQPGDVVINEVMVRAKIVTGRPGQWLEFHNPKNGSNFNLKGCFLVPENAKQGHMIDEDVLLEPGSFRILSNAVLPGGFTPDYTYDDAFDLRGDSGRSRVGLRCGQTVIDKFDRPFDENSGKSYSRSPAGEEVSWCLANAPYNRSEGNDDMGTPGTVNDCR